MSNLTLETSQIVPFFGIVVSIFWFAYKKPVYIPEQEIHIFPWKMQILYALAWTNYAFFQKDLFVYLQVIPAAVTAFIYTLQWHPYLRKRVRRAHETWLTVGLTLLFVATVATSVSPYIENWIKRLALGAVCGAATLAFVVSCVREDIRLAFPTDGTVTERPSAWAFIITGLGIVYGGAWGAYGFYGANDPFVYVCNLLIAAACIFGLLTLLYTAWRAGGLETGWDSQSEEEEFDQHIDRLNRANTRSSYAGSVRSLPRSLSRRVPSAYGQDPEYGVPVGVDGDASASGATLMTEKYPSDEEMAKNQP
ncbi:hypothetical protein HDU96_006322 [Phlyctochytrium bullatum]|nr:hypothetical protein HDU96_006322 [Phlyctochytrium bullatum]